MQLLTFGFAAKLWQASASVKNLCLEFNWREMNMRSAYFESVDGEKVVDE